MNEKNAFYLNKAEQEVSTRLSSRQWIYQSRSQKVGLDQRYTFGNYND